MHKEKATANQENVRAIFSINPLLKIIFHNFRMADLMTETFFEWNEKKVLVIKSVKPNRKSFSEPIHSKKRPNILLNLVVIF